MECKDDNVHCDTWAKDGHCQKSSVYMTKHCKKACGTCGGKEHDRSSAGEEVYAAISAGCKGSEGNEMKPIRLPCGTL